MIGVYIAFYIVVNFGVRFRVFFFRQLLIIHAKSLRIRSAFPQTEASATFHESRRISVFNEICGVLFKPLRFRGLYKAIGRHTVDDPHDIRPCGEPIAGVPGIITRISERPHHFTCPAIAASDDERNVRSWENVPIGISVLGEKKTPPLRLHRDVISFRHDGSRERPMVRIDDSDEHQKNIRADASEYECNQDNPFDRFQNQSDLISLIERLFHVHSTYRIRSLTSDTGEFVSRHVPFFGRLQSTSSKVTSSLSNPGT